MLSHRKINRPIVLILALSSTMWTVGMRASPNASAASRPTLAGILPVLPVVGLALLADMLSTVDARRFMATRKLPTVFWLRSPGVVAWCSVPMTSRVPLAAFPGWPPGRPAASQEMRWRSGYSGWPG